jgi:peptidoglycan/xylan/chitin deacetylase (PgdA/CDA1 family)
VPAPAFRVALTFDAEHPDRPTEPAAHQLILDTLERLSVRATFFLQGRWVEAYPKAARRLAEDGHVVGNHSHFHARSTSLTGRGFAADARAAERAIRSATGVDPRPWFRLPFGIGAERADVDERLRRLGYRHVPWDVDPRDWRRRVGAGAIERAVVEGSVRHGDGAIVLLHAWPSVTAAALDRVVTGLRARGAHLVTVAELAAA